MPIQNTSTDQGENTLSAVVRKGIRQLQESGISDAAYDSFALMEYLTGKNRTYYYLHGEEALTPETCAAYGQLIMRRAGHEPLQQITGTAWFFGYEFLVNSHVLIPRADTEVLVEQALRILKERSREGKEEPAEPIRVLDLCTGSGCMILSLARQIPSLQGVGADISSEALKVAEENRSRLSCGNVSFVQSNLLEQIEGTFSMLVSNPPYIPTAAIAELQPEVREHDPMLALDGKEDGLFFYREIIKEAPAHLRAHGWLLFEIGYDQGEAVMELMKKNGFLELQLVQDLAGNDRVVIGHR